VYYKYTIILYIMLYHYYSRGMGTQQDMRLPWNKSKWFRVYSIHAIQYIILLYTRMGTCIVCTWCTFFILNFFLLPFYYYYYYYFFLLLWRSSRFRIRILLSLSSLLLLSFLSYTNNYFQGNYTRLSDSWMIALQSTYASAVQAL